jgi:hypothetical protein
MADREKLVELIFDIAPYGTSEMFAIHLADHLLTNGVTMQSWIPVSERLPEHGKVVLVYGKRGAIYTAWCNSLYKNPGWHKLNSKNHFCEPTHWMPLPEPPKEE